MVGSRRVRRSDRGQTLLPLRTRHQRQQLSNTISCWYCDFKIYALNGLLFSFGRNHSRILRIWFSVGIGFCLAAVLGVTLLLLWESASLLRLYSGTSELSDKSIVFRFLPSPLAPDFSMSLVDGGYMVLSTLISVAVHEFGHAISAASEGLQVEYIAIFLAVLFPGALVALEYEMLQSLPRFTALRIYCAGIWHNAVCCAACALVLFFLPVLLYPLYVHGAHPMVLDVMPMSPLSGYLSPGDVIVSLDGLQVHNPQEWMERLAVMTKQARSESYSSNGSRRLQEVSGRKGYCIPSSWVENNKNTELADGRDVCPDELIAFVDVLHSNLSSLDPGNNEDGNKKESSHCFSARDIVNLEKCGDGWTTTEAERSSYVCTEDESCSVPVLLPGLTWVEISYFRPYSAECTLLGVNSSTAFASQTSGANKCGGTFVFIGDALPMANSIWLTAYQPRWPYVLGLSVPNMLEKMLACTFHISLTLALLNSLPVFFLDGESILEVLVGYITFLNPRKRDRILRICLFAGTFLSILTCSKYFFSMFLQSALI